MEALQQALFLMGSIVLASAATFFLQALHESPVSPEPLLLPYSSFTSNNILQRVARLGEGILLGPEDISLDKDGTLYTATRDGWIKRMHRNGSWEEWKSTGCSALLGVAVSMAGGVLVCDAEKGLLRVSDEGIAVLTSQVDGSQSQIRFADEAVEASDGSVYFSDASNKFGFHDWYLDVLEARPHGRLLKYDPWKRMTSVVIDGLGFANGVALSAGEDFVVVCETWKFRCLRHWLRGEHKGNTEVFIDNLPGAPDNINLAPDGSFWIALLQLSHRRLRMLHRWKTLKRVIATSPNLVKLVQATNSSAMVVNVPADGGRIARMLDDSEGKVMSCVTSAVEFEGHLYLGSLGTDFIGRLPLEGLAN
uniref:Adipocyte plasma membrane-associated protein n=1 Tax=Anthurium amnicola TaxID=1678845 RepID=A0A1D1XGH1_9ARAE